VDVRAGPADVREARPILKQQTPELFLSIHARGVGESLAVDESTVRHPGVARFAQRNDEPVGAEDLRGGCWKGGVIVGPLQESLRPQPVAMMNVVKHEPDPGQVLPDDPVIGEHERKKQDLPGEVTTGGNGIESAAETLTIELNVSSHAWPETAADDDGSTGIKEETHKR